MQPNIVGGSYGRDKYTRDVTFSRFDRLNAGVLLDSHLVLNLNIPMVFMNGLRRHLAGQKNLLNLTPSLPPESPL